MEEFPAFIVGEALPGAQGVHCRAREGVTQLSLHTSGRMRSSTVLPMGIHRIHLQLCTATQQQEEGEPGQHHFPSAARSAVAPRGGSHFSILCQHQPVLQ